MSGAVVIGGDYRGLGVVRSLGRRGVPVWVLYDEHTLAARSRFARNRLPWPADVAGQLALLDELSTRLAGWALIPTGDETAALLGRHHAELSRTWIVATPAWDVLRWAYDKRLTYELARRVGVPLPRTLQPSDAADVARADVAFPAILKPAVKLPGNAFSEAKGTVVANRSELVAAYAEARRSVPADTLLVQEIVAGGGDRQLSFAALCRDGRPLAWLTARRLRQLPIDVGKASTFVETCDEPDVEELARRLLAELPISGLVEVEFKRDPRDGEPKLLDVNARVWGWHTLGARAGIDFSWELWRMLRGESIAEQHARAGMRWRRTLHDVAAVRAEHRAGRLSAAQCARALAARSEHATFARDDPLPAFVQVTDVVRLWRARSRRPAQPLPAHDRSRAGDTELGGRV